MWPLGLSYIMFQFPREKLLYNFLFPQNDHSNHVVRNERSTFYRMSIPFFFVLVKECLLPYLLKYKRVLGSEKPLELWSNMNFTLIHWLKRNALREEAAQLNRFPKWTLWHPCLQDSDKLMTAEKCSNEGDD